ncbi:MAG: sulfatase family protein [Puniceicoccales bacterium]
MAENKNILFLYCDQMQHNRMGFIDGVAHTPNLDALAREGVHCTHMITQHAQCAPSRASLFTGKSAHECGVMVNQGFFDHRRHLTHEDTTLARVLQNHGYETAYFGKSHLEAPLVDLGFEHGVNYDGKKYSEEQARELGLEGLPNCFISDHLATRDAIDFVKGRRNGSKPLFLTLSLNLPHPPFCEMEEFIDHFPAEKMTLPESYYRETYEGKPAFQKVHVEDGQHAAGNETAQKNMMAQYYSMIAQGDALFGQLMEAMKSQGLWDDTIVLFLSDHGDMMGAHRTIKKGTLPYDELYRVPCLFKLPAVKESSRSVVDDLLSSQAIAGTLLELVGIEVPESFTGGQFLDAFSRTEHPENECVFFEHYAAYWGVHPFYGCRTREFKYVRYYGEDQAEEMYHLESDPNELSNLAHVAEYSEQRRILARLADHWWSRTGGRDARYYASPEFKSGALPA